MAEPDGGTPGPGRWADVPAALQLTAIPLGSLGRSCGTLGPPGNTRTTPPHTHTLQPEQLVGGGFQQGSGPHAGRTVRCGFHRAQLRSRPRPVPPLLCPASLVLRASPGSGSCRTMASGSAIGTWPRRPQTHRQKVVSRPPQQLSAACPSCFLFPLGF